MRSCLLALASLLLIQLLPSADASTCPSICATTTVYGFGAGGVPGCTCTGTGTSRSTSSCQCSICYVQTGTQVYAYSYSNASTETCPFDGTDCSVCDDDSTSASKSTSSSKASSSSSKSSTSTASSKSNTTTTTPTTSSPTPDTTPSPSSNSSSSGSNNVTSSTGSTAGASSTTDSTSSGLQTWQIALIICSACLLFIVIIVALLTCYCRARRSLYENEGRDDDMRFYHRHYASGDAGAVTGAAPAVRAGAAYSSSFPNRTDQFGPYTAGSSSAGLKPMPHGSDPALRNSTRSSTPSSEGTIGRNSRASTGGNGSELYVVGRTSGNGSELYAVNSGSSGNGSDLFATANYGGSQHPSQEYRASRSEAVEL